MRGDEEREGMDGGEGERGEKWEGVKKLIFFCTSLEILWDAK